MAHSPGYEGLERRVQESEAEKQYRTLFDESPISLWEEDFSEVKRYLDALHASGVKDVRQYIADHPEVVARCLSLVKVVRVNKATLTMYEAGSVEEFFGRLSWVLGEESYHVFREELLAVAEGKTRFESEATNRTLKGNTTHILLRWTVAPGHEATLSKVLVSIIDITERKRMEERLENERAFLSAVFDNIEESIIICNEEGIITRFNEASRRLHGLPEEPLPPDQWAEHYHLFQSDAVTPLSQGDIPLFRALRGEHVRNAEIVVSPKNGAPRFLRCNGQPLADAGGRSIGAIVTMHNITDRKDTEAALEKQRRIHQAIIDKAHTHLAYLDPDFNFVAVNTLYARSCHHSPEELIGRNHFDLYPHEENKAIFKRVRESGQPVSFHDKPFEYPDQPERGVTYWDWTLSPVFDNSAHLDGLVLSLVETTERKRAEENLRLAQKAESLGRMAGAIAHRYNNLLSVVMSNLEMALLDLPSESIIADRVAQGINAIHRASETSALMLAYIGQTPSQQAPLDLSMLCRGLLPDLEANTPPHVVLKTDLPEPGPTVKANAAQIQQILQSLVTNAVEALGENRGVVLIGVRTVSPGEIPMVHRQPVSFQAGASGYACLEIADTGCGIAEEEIEKLFDPFYSTKFIGHGLGLPVALGTAKAHGGCIALKTVPGQGSTFCLYLPLTFEAVPRPKGMAPGEAAGVQGTPTVLLAEDDPLTRETCAMVLNRLGMTVIEAKNGMEAVDLFQRHRREIHCVLCDLAMPRMSGWQTIEALRRLAPDIPIILTSGYDEAHVMEHMCEQLPQAFLRKPYSLAALKAALSKAMTDVRA